MPTHGSLTKAGKVRGQHQRDDPRYGRRWTEKKKRPGPRISKRRNYMKYLAGKSYLIPKPSEFLERS